MKNYKFKIKDKEYMICQNLRAMFLLKLQLINPKKFNPILIYNEIKINSLKKDIYSIKIHIQKTYKKNISKIK
jgi:hypothetical protein